MFEKLKFIVKETRCESCKKLIEETVKELKGIEEVAFDLKSEICSITHQDDWIGVEDLFKEIQDLGFSPQHLEADTAESTPLKLSIVVSVFGLLILLLSGYFLIPNISQFELPKIDKEMGYGLLFLVGLLTGFHCVSMCGGFVLSYTARSQKLGVKPYWAHIQYATGKLISYTVVGAVFGLIGGFIAFTPGIRGGASVFAGLFLILFGIKMLDLIPSLRKFRIPLPQKISGYIYKKEGVVSSPVVIGLLNGLMIACGPLQAIYIMAAGTGSAVEGAKLLFIFCLGTLPILISFGFVASFLSRKIANKLGLVSGVIILILGLFMINNGLVLAGMGNDVRSLWEKYVISSVDQEQSLIPQESLPVMSNGYQEIKMTVDRYGWSPDKFIIKSGIPVKWIIQVEELTYCNNAINVPMLGLDFKLKKGVQTIKFTPPKDGIVPWSCWMGMIPGSFIVKTNLNLKDVSNLNEIKNEYDKANIIPARGGSCGGNCSGACGGGCGGAGKGKTCGRSGR